MTDILSWALVVLSIPIIVLLVMHTVRRARALSERIDEHHEEQEAAKQQPGPIDPYRDIGAVFGVQADADEAKREER